MSKCCGEIFKSVLKRCLKCVHFGPVLGAPFGALQWRHNGDDSVPIHQPHDRLLSRLFRRRSKKTSKLRVTGLCAGDSPVTGEFPAQMASNVENVSIWWRHHGLWWTASIYISDDSRRIQKFSTAVSAAIQSWSHTAFRYALGPTRTQADKETIISELYERLACLVAYGAEEFSELQNSAGHILLKKECNGGVPL